MTYPSLLKIKKRWFPHFITERHNSLSFKSYKVQRWKAVSISRRCQISEKDSNCVNFWCRKSLGQLNHEPTSNKTDSFSILDLFYVKIKLLNERNCSKKKYLIKLWYKITKSAAVDCKQAVNDDQRAVFFFPTFAQIIR